MIQLNQQERSLPNGEVLRSYRITGSEYNFSSKLLKVSIASWKSSNPHGLEAPDEETVMNFRLETWEPSIIERLPEILQQHPSWVAGASSVVWNLDAARIDVELPDLDAMRKQHRARIKALRDAAEFGTFTYNGMVFDGDVNAQRRLGGYISVSKSMLAAGQPYEQGFKLANNTWVTLSAQDFVNIEIAKVQQVANAFATAEALLMQIDAATTQEQMEAIQWTL